MRSQAYKPVHGGYPGSLPQPALSAEHARAVAGGLHATSIGGRYPWAPVYIDQGDRGHWEAHNLQTGQKLRYAAALGAAVLLVAAQRAEVILERLDAFLDHKDPRYVAG